MSGLVQEIKELEKTARLFNSAIDDMVSLRVWMGDIENTESQGVKSLLLKLNEVIDKYESMSTGAMSQIKAKGHSDDRVKKYLESYYDGDKVISCRVDKDNTAFAITSKGVFELGKSEESNMYSFWADAILLEFQSVDKLEVSKY